MPSESTEPPRAVPVFLPLCVLAGISAGCFFALTRLVPPILPSAPAGGSKLPRLTAIMPFLAQNPFLCSLAVLVMGGIAFCAAPKDRPLRVTAWFLGGALLLALWGTLLVLLPHTCCPEELPPP
jgi:hypothetical protein